MKKRKFSLILNILSICLSVCAITIGVFAIRNATLNLSGSVGFMAHNCDVDVVAKVYGDSVSDSDLTGASVATGVPRPEANARTAGTANIREGTASPITLGKLYFCDMTEDGTIEPIYIKLEVTNQSIFSIDVYITASITPNNSNIELFKPSRKTLKDKDATNNENKASFLLILELNQQTDITEDVNISIDLNMEKEKERTDTLLTGSWSGALYNSHTLGTDTTPTVFTENNVQSIDFTFYQPDSSYKKAADLNLADSTKTDYPINVYAKQDSVTSNYDVVIQSESKIYIKQGNTFFFSTYCIIQQLSLNNFYTRKLTSMENMFSGLDKLKYLDLSNFDTNSVTTLKDMFFYCCSLKYLNVNGFDTSKVTDMNHMFEDCRSLTNIDLNDFDTSKVTDMSRMFSYCYSLTNIDLSRFNTSNVTNMSCMFVECKKLRSLDLSSFNTSNVTNMEAMFSSSEYGDPSSEEMSLTSLNVSSFDTSKVTEMKYMFIGCSNLTSLDLSNFDTSCMTDMSQMFINCRSLTSLNLSNKFNTSNVSYMESMFSGCSSLTTLDLSNFDTSNVESMYEMFLGCSNLSTINVSSKWSTASVTVSDDMFLSCTKLPNFDANVVDKTNAHTGTGGYLTLKAA